MKFFDKEELRMVLVILGVIIIASLINFSVSLRRARDAQRQADLGSITDALNKFKKDFGSYPPSQEGRILACEKDSKEIRVDTKSAEFAKLDTFERLKIVGRPCIWGKDGFRDFSDLKYPSYLESIPVDPYSQKGYSYYYTSDGKRFQIFARLESSSEPGFDLRIIKRNLHCGNQICNFGRSSFNVPLYKTLEEIDIESKK